MALKNRQIMSMVLPKCVYGSDVKHHISFKKEGAEGLSSNNLSWTFILLLINGTKFSLWTSDEAVEKIYSLNSLFWKTWLYYITLLTLTLATPSLLSSRKEELVWFNGLKRVQEENTIRACFLLLLTSSDILVLLRG